MSRTMSIHARCLHHRRRGQQSRPRLLSGAVRAVDQLELSPAQHEAQALRPRHHGEKLTMSRGSLSQYVQSVNIEDLGRCFTIVNVVGSYGYQFFQPSV